VGCSGYYYPHWKGTFYPAESKNQQFFSFYQERFTTVELNTTFYHFPREKQVDSWIKRSAEGFLFSVKTPRVITHTKGFRECRNELLLFLHLIKPLKESGKLGAILFQTPPSLSCEIRTLEAFLDMLPPGYCYAFEFRNSTFFREELFTLLGNRGADVVSSSRSGSVPFDRVIAPFKYFRLHGPATRSKSNYGDQELAQLARKAIRIWNNGERDLFLYFNNDYNAYAPANAMDMVRLIESMDGNRTND
jgi:uncharacterized protein YecE (DUF72 family)